MLKVLNLYAGIGGNRSLWTNCSVTAVEMNPAIADVYGTLYPGDKVIEDDALLFLEQHFQEFDFIWASPPCPSHGQYRHRVGVLGKGFAPIMPDMSLYAQIVFLRTYFKGKWCVENVEPYYPPLIPTSFSLQRHIFWANFTVENKSFDKAKIRTKNKISDFDNYGAVVGSSIQNKRQVLRNCVDPQLGLHVYNCMLTSL